ncbi:hypothetical protein [Rhodohalobacter barkolensis]|uniref:DUF4145 domain-containing protein n=1 Tax=Rhodohalobacter barkolensis TaxID=2053187 RepID=A0A2N0VHP3_9BACT|nr:hypothetical protein [Rhodohalobacter barkolensis]PKD43699.1 hypothetical protein CWD77_09060 [Rhodohalobacter barkolensis]
MKWIGAGRLMYPPYTQDLFEEITEFLISPNKQVPNTIKEKLSEVKSFYNLRSIDYELQDVAEFLMIMVFELALRTKYNEEKGIQTTKGLTGLLYWAKKKKHLDINQKQIETVVRIRNSFAHIKRPEDLHGTLSSHIIKPVNDWINELYG